MSISAPSVATPRANVPAKPMRANIHSMMIGILLVVGLGQTQDRSGHEGGVPKRIVADEQYVYRLQQPTNPDQPVTLRRMSRHAPFQVQHYVVPGLADVSICNNSVPIDVIDGQLLYPTMISGELGRFDSMLVLSAPEKLLTREYADVRKVPPHGGLIMLNAISHYARLMNLEGDELWFDILEAGSGQYTQFVQFKGTLEIRRHDLRSDNIADRTTETMELPGDLDGPFHAFRSNGATYVLEANGTVHLFANNELTKVGEIRDLQRTNLSSKHVIFHDRSTQEAFILKIDGTILVPLQFTPEKPGIESPFSSALDKATAEILLKSLSNDGPEASADDKSE